MSLTSNTVVALLASRHHKDVFIPECKDGPTHYSSHSRLDAWAMRKSWARPCYWGYEVKVSRSDFVNDNKWLAYLPLCNQLYFVCPAKLIKVEECPADCGLMWVASTGSRVYIKKKAPHRQIEPPVDLLHYALMRAKSFAPYWQNGHGSGSRSERSEFWRSWLSDKRDLRALGRQVGARIAHELKREVTAVQREQSKLKAQQEKLQRVQDWADAEGIDLTRWQWEAEVRRRLNVEVPRELKDALRSVSERSQTLLKKLELLDGGGDERTSR